VVIRSVILAGSRTVHPAVEQIDECIAKLDPAGLLWNPAEWEVIVCGMATGMDLAGKAWAEAKGKRVLEMPITAEHIKRWGKHLGPKMRNRDMAEVADGALLWWDAFSGGTADMCIRMNARDKPVRTFPWARHRKAPR
jgi:hypothetical protein